MQPYYRHSANCSLPKIIWQAIMRFQIFLILHIRLTTFHIDVDVRLIEFDVVIIRVICKKKFETKLGNTSAIWTLLTVKDIVIFNIVTRQPRDQALYLTSLKL